MQLDPEKVAECHSWLARAWADIDAAQIFRYPGEEEEPAREEAEEALALAREVYAAVLARLPREVWP